MKLVKTAAQLDNVRRLKDRSLKITFVTPEKSSQDLAEMDSIIDHLGFLYFKCDSQLTREETEDLERLDPDLYDGKTNSQRLRNHIMVLWNKMRDHGDTDQSKEDFYKDHMERMMISLRSQIKRYDV